MSINDEVLEEASQERMLLEAVKEWGRIRELNDPKAQLNHVTEELGEIAHEINRGHYVGPDIIDAIGDTLVTLIILADIIDLDVMDCLSAAYGEIRDRKGETKNGSFIKNA